MIRFDGKYNDIFRYIVSIVNLNMQAVQSIKVPFLNKRYIVWNTAVFKNIYKVQRIANDY